MRGRTKKSEIKFEKTLELTYSKWYYRKVVLSADDTTPRCNEMCSQEV